MASPFLRRLALVAVTALLLGGAPLAQTPEPAQDDSLEAIRTRANAGDAVAQSNLGATYSTGLGVPQDDAEAVAWYLKAAEQGHAGAQCNLGNMYFLGRGVPRDDEEAVAWYRRAAEQGLADAQYCLGLMYDNGRGVPQDDVEAVAWTRKAAEQGYAGAQNNLGVRYANGEGVPQDDVEAYKWVSIAATYADAEDRERYAEARDRAAARLTRTSSSRAAAKRTVAARPPIAGYPNGLATTHPIARQRRQLIRHRRQRSGRNPRRCARATPVAPIPTRAAAGRNRARFPSTTTLRSRPESPPVRPAESGWQLPACAAAAVDRAAQELPATNQDSPADRLQQNGRQQLGFAAAKPRL